jgi:hypothetical protein
LTTHGQLLGAAAVVVDLDDPAYLDRSDLTEYARRCLLVEGVGFGSA